MMNERRMVQLSDGRVGKIVRVDTLFPDNATTVTVWTNVNEADGPASASGPASGPGIRDDGSVRPLKSLRNTLTRKAVSTSQPRSAR